MLDVSHKALTSSYHTLCFFFFNDTATTEIYTLSLHDALPIYLTLTSNNGATLTSNDTAITVTAGEVAINGLNISGALAGLDRKSTRLNSSHLVISYAVFCLKKKKHT